MKIALIGYGKMGKTIEQIALNRGHQIVSIVDINNPEEFQSANFKSADVAIEFTTPATAFDNYMKSFAAGVPVVSGTTGWLDRIGEIKEKCEKEGKTFFYASNFSIGVNIFFALNKYLAKIMNNFPSYNISMTETIKSCAHRMMVDYVMSAVLNNQLPEKAKEYANFFTGDIEGLRDALRSRIKLMGRRPTDWS